MRAQHHSSLRISRGHRHAAAGALLVVVTVATPRADASDAPSPRWGHAMAYDSARDRIVLFGGADSLEDRMADTWEWSGDGWMRLPATGPPPRAYAAMAFDPVREGRGPPRRPRTGPCAEPHLSRRHVGVERRELAPRRKRGPVAARPPRDGLRSLPRPGRSPWGLRRRKRPRRHVGVGWQAVGKGRRARPLR